jgi:signal peptidase I
MRVMDGQAPNPYAPGTAVSTESPGRPTPRWLAVLGTLINIQPFTGVGLFLLGRRRRAWIWLGIGVGLSLLTIISARASASRLCILAFVVYVLAGLAAVADTLTARRDESVPALRHPIVFLLALFVLGRGLAAGVRLWVVEAFQVPAASMAPTLLVGDHIMVKKTKTVAVDDVIVFKYPLGPDIEYVKRVVAVAGDTIEVRQEVVYVNGQPWPRDRSSAPCPADAEAAPCTIWNERSHQVMDTARPGADFAPHTVPPGKVFVMGDNRHNSNDSRVWGYVSLDLVVGKVLFIWWSREPHGAIRRDRIAHIVR